MAQAVRIALECGYRHIDTAGCYLNEEDIGKILEGFFKDGKLRREDLFITTKVSILPYFENVKLNLNAKL